MNEASSEAGRLRSAVTSEKIGHALGRCGLRVAASLAALFLMSFLASCKKKEAASEGVPAPGAEEKTAVPTERGPTVPKPGPALSAQITLKIGASSGLSNPRGVAVDGTGNTYVVDAGNNRVLKFDPSGKQLLSFGKKGSGPGQFLQAWFAAVSPQGNVLVLDAETAWIQVFTPAGKLLNRLGGPDMRLYHPSGLAVAPDGTVVVADTGGSRIVPIDPDGKPRTPLSGAGKEPFSQPTDIYVDPRGGLHVYQTAGSKTPSTFYHLTPTGELEAKWVAPDAPSTLDTPRAVLAADGRLYVTDPQNQQIRVYDADGAAYHPLRVEGPDAAPFRILSGIAVDAQGHVYAADAGANAVYRLQLSAPR